VHRVRTAIGDDILPRDLSGQVFIKIDIEGFEPNALRGLTGTIDRYRPYVLTEVEPAHLARAGSSPEELFAMMERRGYAAFDIAPARAPLRYRCRLRPVADRKARGSNVLWAHETMANRLAETNR
jgi:hypothetical protein